MILTANPKRLVEVTFGGRTFKASQATYGNLLDTQERLTERMPSAVLQIVQPCWNTGVAASAGTHDKDAVVDVRIPQMTWTTAQKFLRQCGWAAWWRHTGEWAAESAWHIHMVSLGAYEAGNPVGVFVPGQVDDYRAHRSGLVGHVADPTWHPADIDKTVFDYADWWENDMPYSNWPKADKDALTSDVAKAVLASPVNALAKGGEKAFAGMTVRDLLKKVAKETGAV